MKRCTLLAAAFLLLAADAPEAGNGMHFIAGGFEEQRQPDGNSIVFEAPGGLLVVDSGRHPEHQRRILDLARRLDKPIATLVNTHWHLDHSGGNAELRAAYPGLRIVASRAVEGALDGFLAKGLASSDKHLAAPRLSEARKAEIRGDAEAIRDRRNLLPDVPVERATTLPVDGRSLELLIAPHAVTAGDLWLYDPATGTAVVGDLVTLPVPFLDTACPEGWRSALDAVAARAPARVIPGHGAPMSAADFETYRTAFARLLDCGVGGETATMCSDGWIADLGPLLPAAEHKRARAMLAYYLDARLRPIAKRQEYCLSRD